ncbi:MAG: DUF6057 family protein, partial [Kiritimatiellia bacterium]
PVAALVCAAAFVPCGAYALFAGGVLGLDAALDLWRRPKALCARVPPACALLALTPWLAACLVYDDLAVGLALGRSQSVLCGALLETFGLWPVAAFLLLGWELIGRGARIRPYVAGALCALVFVAVPPEDLRHQLRMERLVLEGRDAEALALDDTNPHPIRMTLAYRVLALWRTGRLETDLFRRPFTSFHRTSRAQETKMDGQQLLFAYGFLLPARQQTIECVAARGWQPPYLQLLGDVAFLTGERALAVRNWRQLARCPFRGEVARRRLAGLAAGKGLDDPAFAHLRPVAMLAGVWDEAVRQRATPPFFYFKDASVESFVYGRCLTVKGKPPTEVARLILAAYLLEKDAKAFVRSRGVMDALCPQGPWPRLWQQGVLSYLGGCSDAERDRVVASLRAGVFSNEEVARMDAFVADLKRAKTTPVDFAARYGDTYYFYDLFVK